MHAQVFEWAVIGAGPAGIAAVGKLIDKGIPPQQIAWLDPEFKVGDFGTQWRNVSSNTKVELFLKFFTDCQAFNYQYAPDFPIQHLPQENTCLLALAAEPLLWITEQLVKQVTAIKTQVQQLQLINQLWKIRTPETPISTKNIILSIGAEPRSMAIADLEEIHLTTALNPAQLISACKPDDTIAVFGSSHSAIIILRTLIEQCHIKKVINFYQSPLRYAIYMDDFILFDNTGLKGEAAAWARLHIDGELPQQLVRVLSNPKNLQTILPQCNKFISATGFNKRHITIDGIASIEYDNKTGIIAPGLFGLGIAFPEQKTDRSGNVEYSVGLWKFMDYLNRIMPIWLKYHA